MAGRVDDFLFFSFRHFCVVNCKFHFLSFLKLFSENNIEAEFSIIQSYKGIFEYNFSESYRVHSQNITWLDSILKLLLMES